MIKPRILIAWVVLSVVAVGVYLGQSWLWPEAVKQPRQSRQPRHTLEQASQAELAASLGIENADSRGAPGDRPVIDVERWQTVADQALDKVRREYPGNAQAEHLWGVAQMRLKRTKLAEPSLQAAIRLAPSDWQMRIDYAELLMQLGRNAEALATLDSLKTNASLPSAWYELLAECHQRLGDLEAARTGLQKVVELNPQSEPAWIRLGALELQRAQAEAAEAAARRALELNSQAAEAWQLLGRALALQQKTEQSRQALKSWQQLVSTATKSTEQAAFEVRHAQDMGRVLGSIFRSLGLFYQSLGRTADAETMLARALEVNDQDALALASWAAIVRRLGDFERALQLNRRLLTIAPQEPAHYQNLANLYMELNQPHDAEAALRLACMRLPEDGRLHELLARFLMLLNRPKQALPIAERANQLLKTAATAQLVADITRAAENQP